MKPTTSYQNAALHLGDGSSNDGVVFDESSSVIKNNNRLAIFFKALLSAIIIVAASGVVAYYLAATPLNVRLNSQTFPFVLYYIFLNAKLIFWICITL